MVVGALQIVLQLLGRGHEVGAPDLVLMPLLATYVSLATRRTRLATLTVVGLGFSWLGDCAGGFLLIKIAFFLGAQVAYAASFWPYRSRSLLRRPVLLVGYTLAIAALTVVMASHAGPLAAPVAVYGVGVALMAVLATGVNSRVGLGGMLFLLSDIVLASYFFLGEHVIPASLAVNSLLYYPGQLLIATGMARCRRAEQARPTDDLAAVPG